MIYGHYQMPIFQAFRDLVKPASLPVIVDSGCADIRVADPLSDLGDVGILAYDTWALRVAFQMYDKDVISLEDDVGTARGSPW